MRQAKRQKKQLILIGKLKEIIKTDGCNYAVIPIRVILNGEKIGSCNAEIINEQKLRIGESYVFELEQGFVANEILKGNLTRAKKL